tara:strand:+ start:83 stop:1000 length:918 start_codon:yes stop_codon:yes gene_type:complete
MENYLYFAEADVETGDDGSSEALVVPASSFIGAEPGSGTTTLYFKGAMGENSGTHTVVLTHTVGKNKEVMRGVMACINASPSEGGFVVVANSNAAGLTFGTEYNKVFDGLGMSTVAITEEKLGGLVGDKAGTIDSTSFGEGIIGVGSATVPRYHRYKQGQDIITTMTVDLTGSTSNNVVDDIIGKAAGGAAYWYKRVDSVNGVIYKIEMSCLELPTASSNPGLDIDIRSDANPARIFDYGAGSLTAVLASGGNLTQGTTIQTLVGPHGEDGHYFYFTVGGSHSGSSVYTGGQLMVKFYGHPLRTA